MTTMTGRPSETHIPVDVHDMDDLWDNIREAGRKATTKDTMMDLINQQNALIKMLIGFGEIPMSDNFKNEHELAVYVWGKGVEKDKYKAFRNYMVHELGITKEDIKGWAEQSAISVMNKTLTPDVIMQFGQNAVNNKIYHKLPTTRELEGLAREVIAKQMARSVKFSVEVEEISETSGK